MYGATELSKMFNTTRQTIYVKWKDVRLKDYFIEIEGKRKFKSEGLQLFAHIMAESKVIESLDVKITPKPDVMFTPESDTKNDNITIEYINNLKQQIEDLKRDKILLQEQLSQLMNTFINKQQLLESSSKGHNWFLRIFNR